jgi:chromosomal replication initiator protein
MKSFWEEVKGQLKKQLPIHTYRMWIEPVQLIDHTENKVYLSSPNAYFINRLKSNYLSDFQNAFKQLGLKNIQIDFKVVPRASSRSATKTHPAAPTSVFKKDKPIRARQRNLPGLCVRFNNGRLFKKGHTFNDFVVGDNSDFAYSASLSLAQGKINGSGILYLLAKTGLGKSHLSQAVGHHILTNSQAERVYYITAEDFTNEMIFSLKNHKIEEFKTKYRTQCDVLILEDIHFLSGKDATQKELAITLDYLLDANKKIIFSGCELPDEIPKLNDQLKSRLGLGLVTEIGRPDYKTRVRILKKKSKIYGFNIPNPVTEYIAQELCDDVRQLESGLAGVAAKGSLMGYDIDIALAKSVLANISKAKKRVTIDSIRDLVCNEFSVSKNDILSPSRKKRIVKPRQVAMFLSKKYTDQPIKQIGKSFNKYHATAIYAINAIEKEIKQKGALYGQVNYLSKKIESGKL